MPKFKSVNGNWIAVNEVSTVTTDKTETSTVNFDLNDDGKVDKQDASIAGKVLNVTKTKKKRSSRRYATYC